MARGTLHANLPDNPETRGVEAKRQQYVPKGGQFLFLVDQKHVRLAQLFSVTDCNWASVRIKAEEVNFNTPPEPKLKKGRQR